MVPRAFNLPPSRGHLALRHILPYHCNVATPHSPFSPFPSAPLTPLSSHFLPHPSLPSASHVPFRSPPPSCPPGLGLQDVATKPKEAPVGRYTVYDPVGVADFAKWAFLSVLTRPLVRVIAGDECPICLGQLPTRTSIATAIGVTPSGHQFHWQCIATVRMRGSERA